jgi:hypothetical protein
MRDRVAPPKFLSIAPARFTVCAANRFKKNQLLQCKNTATIYGKSSRFEADVVQVLGEGAMSDFCLEPEFKIDPKVSAR